MRFLALGSLGFRVLECGLVNSWFRIWVFGLTHAQTGTKGPKASGLVWGKVWEGSTSGLEFRVYFCVKL